MIKRIRHLIALLPFAVTLSAAPCLAAGSPLGTWLDETAEGAVEITDCGGKLCGRIVWLKSEKNAEACHLQIIGNVAAVGRVRWGGGWIFDPETRAKFDVEITPVGQDKLRVLGYAGSKMLGQTMMWTRAPADLKRCGESQSDVVTAQASPQHTASAVADSKTLATATPATGSLAANSVSVPDSSKPTTATSATIPQRQASGTDASADATSKRTDPRAALEKKRAKPEQVMRLAELGADIVRLSKSRGVCKLTISELGRVSFPC